MKKLIVALLMALPMTALAQNTTDADKVAALQAEAAAKAQAAQEAARAAQEAARLAQEAAEAAAAEAARLSKEAAATPTAPVVEEETNWSVAPVEEKGPTLTAAEQRRIEREEAANSLAPYLALDAVPVVDGKVKWVREFDVPGKTAQQLYDATLKQLTLMTKEERQLERSKVALINEKEHKMAATFQEWLVFTSSILSLDRTKFNYLLMAECTDGHVRLTLDHVTYNYPTQKETLNYQAEKWIVDQYSVNKKRTRLLPLSGKFRKKTIDRKEQIFNDIEKALKE